MLCYRPNHGHPEFKQAVREHRRVRVEAAADEGGGGGEGSGGEGRGGRAEEEGIQGKDFPGEGNDLHVFLPRETMLTFLILEEELGVQGAAGQGVGRKENPPFAQEEHGVPPGTEYGRCSSMAFAV